MKLQISNLYLIKIITLNLIVIGFIGCEKSEKPIKPFDRGGVITTTIGMGNNYQNHIFFNLDSNKIIKTINRMDWDLAFDCRENNHILMLNGGRGINAAATGKTDFKDIKDTIGLKFRYDHPDLKSDSMALGPWWLIPDEIYIINLGVDNFGLALGFIKCMPHLEADKSIKLLWCKLSETLPISSIITKNQDYNFAYFSLVNNSKVNIEPPKKDWDLWFTQYVKWVYSSDFKISQNYQLTGVLINHDKLQVAEEFNKNYIDISTTMATQYTYTNTRDEIGYDWKTFDFGTNSYKVNSRLNYLIKIKNGFYYKMHFLDFYNDLGIKGYPKFEFQKL